MCKILYGTGWDNRFFYGKQWDRMEQTYDVGVTDPEGSLRSPSDILGSLCSPAGGDTAPPALRAIANIYHQFNDCEVHATV